MKKLLIALVIGGLWLQTQAAENVWLTDLPKAKAQAKKEHKMVFMEFTGSDWCPPCKALDKNVLTSDEFINYAKTNLVLVEIDFPHNKPQSDELKKANKELATKYDLEGVPTVLVFASDGKQLLKQVGYGGQTPKDFIAKIDALKNN